MDIKQQIKSFEDACKILGIDTILPDVEGCMEKDRKSIIAFYKLTIIIRALNQGWEPELNNYRQEKFYNFWLFGGAASDGSGCGLSASSANSGFSIATSDVGARLAFKSRELAEYAAKQFIDLYSDFLLV